MNSELKEFTENIRFVNEADLGRFVKNNIFNVVIVILLIFVILKLNKLVELNEKTTTEKVNNIEKNLNRIIYTKPVENFRLRYY